MTRPAIAYADPFAAVVPYLTSSLSSLSAAGSAYEYADNVTVGVKLLDTPTRYIWVRRVGGLKRDEVVDNARLDFMVWHDGTTGDRVKLASAARAYVLAMEGSYSGVTVYNVIDFLGPTDLPDPNDQQKTVTLFTVELSLRGTELPA